MVHALQSHRIPSSLDPPGLAFCGPEESGASYQPVHSWKDVGLGRIIESQLLGIEPWDPLTLAGAGILLLGATLAASYLPAR